MAEPLESAPARQAVIDRGNLLVEREWLRWLELVRTRLLVLGQGLADLEALVAALQAQADALSQETTLTLVAVNGAAVVVSGILAPAGATVQQISWRVDVSFNGSLASLLLGDGVANDRWGQLTSLTAGSSGGMAGARGPAGFVTAAGYTVSLAALGGTFGTLGALVVRCRWMPALAAPA